MIIIDRDIRALLRQGELILDPFEDRLVQPSSVDLRLDRFVRILKEGTEELDIRDPRSAEQYEEANIGDDGFLLRPHGLLLGQTLEYMRIPDTCQGMIAQRSSLMRLGIHVSSSLINPGYAGNLPCLLTNRTDRPIRIFSGIPVCQLVLIRLTGRPDITYPEKPDAKYHEERRFLTSGIAKDAQQWVRPSPRLAHPEQANEFVMEVTVADPKEDA